MDIQQLKYFVEIARQQSYTRAAEQLFVTQPMLTRCIKMLEAEFNVKLIERSSKYFRLTDAGRALYQYSVHLLQRYQDLYRAVEDVKVVRSGEVRISSPGVLLDMYFPPLLTNFRRENPGISISIIEEGSTLSAQSVLNGEVDLGLVMLPVSNMCDFEIIPVIRDEVRLLVRKDHPFAAKEEVQFSELQGVDVITYSYTATLHDSFISQCSEHGFKPNIVYKSLMPIFTVEMVSMGSCIGVLPYPMIRRYQSDDLTSVRLHPQFPWQIAMILKKDRYRSFATQRLANFITAYLQRLAANPE